MRTIMSARYQNTCNYNHGIEKQYFSFSCSNFEQIGKKERNFIENKRFYKDNRMLC